MNTSSINLQYLGRFHNLFPMTMVGTSIIAIMEFELKEALIMLWLGILLIGMVPTGTLIGAIESRVGFGI